jgi:hypothetical protein
MSVRSSIDKYWENEKGLELLSYDGSKGAFKIKAGTIKAAEAAELVEALNEALEYHDQQHKKDKSK